MYSRRAFLTRAAIAGAYTTLAAYGGLFGSRCALADWIEDNFAPGKLEQTLERLFANSPLVESDAISLKLPLIAEDGAVVPITVSSALHDVESIAILVEKNPVPLTAIFNVALEAEAFVSTHIKMAETCDVIAVLKAGDNLYCARQQVKVTIGGCGG